MPMLVKDRNANRRLVFALALICLFLELGIAPNIAIGNGRINFALVFTSCIALTFGGKAGVIAGFASGLIFDLSTTGPVGLMALLLTVSSYVLGIEVRNRIAEDSRNAIKNHAICCAVVSVLYSIIMLAAGDTSSLGDALLSRALPTCVMSFLAFLPFAFFLSRRGSHGPDLSGSSSVLKSDRSLR